MDRSRLGQNTVRHAAIWQSDFGRRWTSRRTARRPPQLAAYCGSSPVVGHRFWGHFHALATALTCMRHPQPPRSVEHVVPSLVGQSWHAVSLWRYSSLVTVENPSSANCATACRNCQTLSVLTPSPGHRIGRRSWRRQLCPLACHRATQHLHWSTVSFRCCCIF